VAPVIHAVIVSPRALLVRGLRELLTSSRVALVVGTLRTVEELPALLHARHPQLLVLDLDVEGLDEPTTLHRILRARPGIRILGVDRGGDPSIAKRIARSRLGLVVSSNAGDDELLDMLDALAPAQRARARTHPVPGAKAATLTPRQCEVLTGVADGLSNRQIASALGLSEGTVKRHLFRAFRVVEASSRIDAVNRARALGLIGEQETSIVARRRRGVSRGA
jgi:DNA-binding NarL/FixJ family response regulator